MMAAIVMLPSMVSNHQLIGGGMMVGIVALTLMTLRLANGTVCTLLEGSPTSLMVATSRVKFLWIKFLGKVRSPELVELSARKYTVTSLFDLE